MPKGKGCGPYRMTNDRLKSNPNSYSNTSASPKMHRNPKQSGYKRTSDPFPTAVDAGGTRQTVAGNSGLPGKSGGDGTHRGGSPKSRQGDHRFG